MCNRRHSRATVCIKGNRKSLNLPLGNERDIVCNFRIRKIKLYAILVPSEEVIAFLCGSRCINLCPPIQSNRSHSRATIGIKGNRKSLNLPFSNKCHIPLDNVAIKIPEGIPVIPTEQSITVFLSDWCSQLIKRLDGYRRKGIGTARIEGDLEICKFILRREGFVTDTPLFYGDVAVCLLSLAPTDKYISVLGRAGKRETLALYCVTVRGIPVQLTSVKNISNGIYLWRIGGFQGDVTCDRRPEIVSRTVECPRLKIVSRLFWVLRGSGERIAGFHLRARYLTCSIGIESHGVITHLVTWKLTASNKH